MHPHLFKKYLTTITREKIKKLIISKLIINGSYEIYINYRLNKGINDLFISLSKNATRIPSTLGVSIYYKKNYKSLKCKSLVIYKRFGLYNKIYYKSPMGKIPMNKPSEI